jgi:prepilin-type N-terminal cleavage/methylation domain-containing protein
MGCTSNRNQHGFTLVEISIVMIIIGLLIGGTFGGMKLIENMQVNKTVQDLKAIESAALTFKDTYGRLPGDMPNTAARLPSCTDAPCATGGNGDRALDGALAFNGAIVDTNERFTFWSHLQAAGLLTVGTKNVTDLNFGEGQPDNPIDGGYRAFHRTAVDCQARVDRTNIALTRDATGIFTTTSMRCAQFEPVDKKMDDGMPRAGAFSTEAGCGAVCGDPYLTGAANTTGYIAYDLKGF